MEQKQLHNLFHRFIEISADKPIQSCKFNEFSFMEQQIRKQFKQLKKTSSSSKKCPFFIDYWKQLSKETQVQVYSKWKQLLCAAVQRIYQSAINKPIFTIKQGLLYIKKSSFGKWQKKSVKLKDGIFAIVSSKNLFYPLKFYEIRKSKNKEHFAWVLELVMENKLGLKSLHCGTNNIKEYDEWFHQIDFIIREQRQKKENQNLPFKNELLKSQQVKNQHMHTITQMVIQNEMKINEEMSMLKIESQMCQQNQQQSTRLQKHPNIFSKLLPNRQITNLDKIDSNANLLWQENNAQIYEVLILDKQQTKSMLKLITTINFNQQLVFEALTEKIYQWNTDIENYIVKTKISSENSALIYQKDKPQGFLYRSRDYLYLRHCFSTKKNQEKKIYIIDRSIDSVSHPPFMTVTRGEKQLIWELTGITKQSKQQCRIIIEGMTKGGGYMSQAQSRDMTLKAYKKIMTLLNQYLKNKNIYPNQEEEAKIFVSNWEVQEQLVLQSKQSKIKKVEQQKDQEYNEFIKRTSQNHQKLDQSCRGPSETDISYKPPAFRNDKTVIVPNTYLFQKHFVIPKQKVQKPQYAPQYHNHNIWHSEWEICNTGGLVYIDMQRMKEQKKVLTFIIKSIGKNILSGKSVLNLSLPVDIFALQSNIQKLAMSFGYAPVFLEKASFMFDQLEQMKYVIATGIPSSLIYIGMQKPFNPILGETFQCYVDGCPVYFEQISHHPPIAAYMMIGRGYKITGTLEAKMDISINSGTGCNEGIFTVTFDNGSVFHYTTSTGYLTGLTYGQRNLCMIGKIFYWSCESGLFLQIQYDPYSKKSLFFGSTKKYIGQEKLHDYFEGRLKRYNPQQLKDFLKDKKNGNKMTIPKSAPSFKCVEELYKVSGRWTKSIYINDEEFMNIDQTRYYDTIQEENPLPSNSNFREDIVYRKLANFVTSQEFKEILETKQRKDRKLREQYDKQIKNE